MAARKRRRRRSDFNPGIFVGGLVPGLLIDLAMHGSIEGAVGAGAAAVILAVNGDRAVAWAKNAYDRIPLPAPLPRRASGEDGGKRNAWQRMWNLPARSANTERRLEEADDDLRDTDDAEDLEAWDEEEEEEELADDEIDLFAEPDAEDTGGVERLTIEEIVTHITPNSYKIYVGRSMTKPNNPAVSLQIRKRHFQFIGTSQRGKTSMVAAFLEIVTRTHDRKHVLLALLDMENKTGNLFADLPHVAKLRLGNEFVPLHARNEDQVLTYLAYVHGIMKQRYQLSKEQLDAQPILLVYLEEFLSLKNRLKARIQTAERGVEKERAQADYHDFVFYISDIAQLGLKVFVQLLLCAQVEYADEDLREALVNIDCGFALCVPPRAALAAGFRNNELLNQNHKANKVGQAVVEAPGCNDIVLAPQYSLDEVLRAHEGRTVPPLPKTRIPPLVTTAVPLQSPDAPVRRPSKYDRLVTIWTTWDWESGKKRSYRNVGALLGLEKDAAGELIKEAKRAGLISGDETGND